MMALLLCRLFRNEEFMGRIHRLGRRACCLAALALVAASGAIGCGSSSNASSTPPPTVWLGPTPHFRAVGTINGEHIDIDITGDAAKDVTKLWCEREYQVPADSTGAPVYPMGHNSEVRIDLPYTVNGQARKLE